MKPAIFLRSGLLGCVQETAPSDSADEIDLGSGDRLVFCTDGPVEVFNPNGGMLGEEGLARLSALCCKTPAPGNGTSDCERREHVGARPLSRRCFARDRAGSVAKCQEMLSTLGGDKVLG